jgi:hypothetical protein
VETDSDGVRHWRDVVFAHFRGFRPLTAYVSSQARLRLRHLSSLFTAAPGRSGIQL